MKLKTKNTMTKSKQKNALSDEAIEKKLNMIFNAGMKNHKLHPDDDSYDTVNKQDATKSVFLLITELRDARIDLLCEFEELFIHTKDHISPFYNKKYGKIISKYNKKLMRVVGCSA